jgi:hypothetical protein
MRVAFPGESAEYRAARDRLLEEEIAKAVGFSLPAGGGERLADVDAAVRGACHRDAEIRVVRT